MAQYLKNTRCYLSGPIESANYNEPDWRTQPKKTLFSSFGINVFDPFSDPKQQKAKALYEARERGDIKTIQSIAKPFVRKDLGEVDESKFIIAYVPSKVPTVGTVHEIINSNNAKKPTLLVSSTDRVSDIALWYFGFINLEFMFPNWEALYAYLSEVDVGMHKDNDRWSLVYGDI